jgi:hypothetical protein
MFTKELANAFVTVKKRLLSRRPGKTDLWGFFDAFEEGRFLSGWVQDRNDETSQNIEVQIELDGKIVATGTPLFQREKGLPGYKIDIGSKITALHIVDSRVKVYAVGCDGERVKLVRWAPLNRALLAKTFPRDD